MHLVPLEGGRRDVWPAQSTDDQVAALRRAHLDRRKVPPHAGGMDVDRYHRQTLLPQIGQAGQRRLGEGHVLIVGCGALGSAQADLLVRAGVGSLLIVDRDFVEMTNLQRQTLYEESDARQRLPKAIAAKERLRRINSEIAVQAVVDDFNYLNAYRYALESPRRVDVILDGLDNFQTRYLLNDLAVRHGIPYVYGGAVGTTGLLLPILPCGESGEERPWRGQATPCLRCLFEDEPPPGAMPTCDTAGVLGTGPHLIAGLQVTEALKILLGEYRLVRRSLLSIDLWAATWRELALPEPGPQCPCCGARTFPYLNGERGDLVTSMCGTDSVQIIPTERSADLDLAQLESRLVGHGDFQRNRFLLRGTLLRELNHAGEPYEITVFRDGRTIVRGTADVTLARALCAKYVGA